MYPVALSTAKREEKKAFLLLFTRFCLPLQPKYEFFMQNPAMQTGIVRMLSRLWVVMLLLCSLPLNGAGGESIHGVRGEADKTECIASHDGWHSDMMQQHRMALAGTVITAKTGERVGGSRPSRLMPTHGGKPGRTIGRWAVSSSFHLSTISALLHRHGCGLQVWAAFPRYYYVIALRRLLC